MSKLLTVAQVAEICGVTNKTVLNWIRAGQLEAVKLPSDRGVRIQEKVLEKSLIAIEPGAEARLDD